MSDENSPLSAGPKAGRRSTIQRVMSLVTGRAGGNALTLVYTMILARIATPEDFGLVMTGFSWAMLLSVVLALNVESGSIKYLVRYRQNDQPGRVAGFLKFNLYIILGLTALTALGYAALWGVGLVDPRDEASQVFALALLSSPVVALTRVYGRHATALGQVLRGGLPIMFVRPAVICVLLGAVWLAGGHAGTVVLMLLMLVAFVVTALLQGWLLRKTFAFARSAQPDYTDTRDWLVTGAAMAPLLLMRDNLKHVVVASAGLALSPADVGFVALAFSIMSLVYFSIKAVDIALSPQLSHAVQAAAHGKVAHTLRSAMKLKLVALVLGVAASVLFGKYGLVLFGPEYQPAFWPLVIFMLIPAADALLGAAQIVLNVSGRQSAVFWSAGLSSGVLIGAVALGGVLGGAEGAALGAGLSYALQQMALWWVCRSSAKIETSVACLWLRPVIQL